MPKKSLLQQLKEMSPELIKKLTEFIKDTELSKDFWKRELETIKQLDKETEEFEKSTRMSHERFHRPFDM